MTLQEEIRYEIQDLCNRIAWLERNAKSEEAAETQTWKLKQVKEKLQQAVEAK